MAQQLIKKNISRDSILPIITKLKPKIILAIFSFFISRLSVTNGISPFSQAYMLAVGNSLSALILSIAGILTNNALNKHKYIFISLFTFTVQLFIKKAFPKLKQEITAPFVLFASSFIFGLIFTVFKEYVAFDILLILLDAFLSVVFFYVASNFLNASSKPGKKYLTSEEYVAPLIVLCIVIAGIGNLQLPYDILLKNILCIYVILITSLYSNIGTTAQLAVFMGISAGLGMDYFPLFLSAYSINALFCSVFAKYGKITAVLGFTVGNIVISVLLSEARYMVISFQDIALSSILFVLTPEKLLGKFNYYLNLKTRNPENADEIKNITAIKLERMSNAFKKLANTISEPQKKAKYTDTAVFESVADKVCKGCAMRFFCWDKERQKTIEAFLKITDKLIKEGTACISDFPQAFSKKCIKKNDILNNIFNAYEIIRLNTVWETRMKENVKIYKDQFYELADIINNLKSEIEENPFFDNNLSNELAAALESEGILVKSLSVLKDCNNRSEVEIFLFPCNQTQNKCYDAISSVLYDHMNLPFRKVSGKCSFKECHLHFTETENFTLETSVKQKARNNGEKNGDSWLINTLENGNRYIAICDGSGSGANARISSEKTVKLLDEFLKTGFSEISSVKLINSSFINSDIQECVSTVDLGLIDLKTGEFRIVKKGASPTYILRENGEYDVVESNTLPLGVFGGEKGKIKKTLLSHNDIIVMVSDGICDSVDKEDWIVDAMSAIKTRNPDEIADIIMKIANTSSENGDDKTVIVSKLKKIG